MNYHIWKTLLELGKFPPQLLHMQIVFISLWTEGRHTFSSYHTGMEELRAKCVPVKVFRDKTQITGNTGLSSMFINVQFLCYLLTFQPASTIFIGPLSSPLSWSWGCVFIFICFSHSTSFSRHWRGVRDKEDKQSWSYTYTNIYIYCIVYDIIFLKIFVSAVLSRYPSTTVLSAHVCTFIICLKCQSLIIPHHLSSCPSSSSSSSPSSYPPDHVLINSLTIVLFTLHLTRITEWSDGKA